jgi:hypothetical protein
LPEPLVAVDDVEVTVVSRLPSHDDKVLSRVRASLTSVMNVMKRRVLHIPTANPAARVITLDDL